MTSRPNKIKIKGSSEIVKKNSSYRKTRETHLMKHLNSIGFGLNQSGEIVGVFSNKSKNSIIRGTLDTHRTAGRNDMVIDSVILEMDILWINEYIRLKKIKKLKDLF